MTRPCFPLLPVLFALLAALPATAGLPTPAAIAAPADAVPAQTTNDAGGAEDAGAAVQADAKAAQERAELERGLAYIDNLPSASPAVTDSLAAVGGALLLRGYPDLATRVFARSIALRKANGRDMALARHYLAVGSGFATGDRFAEAEEFRREAVALMKSLDARPAGLAEALTDLGISYNSRGKYEQARAVLEQAVGQIDNGIGKNSMKLVAPLQMLGGVHLALGQPDLAEAVWRRRLALCETESGDHADLRRGAALSDLALLHAQAKQYAEAERLLLQALALRKKADLRPTFGTAVALNRLANVYRDSGRAQEAEATFERALALMQSIPASAGWDTAAVLHDYGVFLRQQDQAGQAAALFAQAFALRVAVQPVHHLTRQSADALAALYRAGGKEAAALQVEERMRVEVLRSAQDQSGAAPSAS